MNKIPSGWSEINEILKALGYGGVWFRYAAGNEFLGFGDHIEYWDVAELTMCEIFRED